MKTPTAVNSLLQSFLVIKSATFVLDLLSYLILWQIDTKRNLASWLFHINCAIEQEVSDQTMLMETGRSTSICKSKVNSVCRLASVV